MSRVGVITLHKERPEHLRRLLEGLARGAAPERCMVVEMGGATDPLPHAPFPLSRLILTGGVLPLAAARNAGASTTSGDHLVFLDVDCIPSVGLIDGFDNVLAEHDCLVCCAIHYLPAGAVQDDWCEADLKAAGRLHPVRSFPHSGVQRIENAGLFWSLAFAIRRRTFDRIGGFDSGFTGYGAEDTDFAFRARDAGVPLLFAGGFEAYHQHHPAYDPPLQHFADIIRNATRFQARHGIWPMEGWLDAFTTMGLIEPDRSRGLHVIREPNPAEIDAARLPDTRPF